MMNLGRYLHLRMQGASIDTPVYNDLGGGGGTTNTNTVTQTDPWWAAQPHLANLFSNASNQYQQVGGGHAPGLTVAAPDEWTTRAQNLQAQRAEGGSALTQGAQAGLLPTVTGGYLDPGTNPAWAPMSQRITEAYRQGTAAPLDAQFAGSGNAFMDNSAYQELRGQNERGLGDSLSSLAGGLYNEERDRMMQGALISPQLAQQDYADIDKLGQAGQMREGQQQRLLDAPWDTLTRYQRLISNQPGGASNTSGQTPYFQNNAANAMGMGLMGMSIYELMNQ